jgi:hypothetical protein
VQILFFHLSKKPIPLVEMLHLAVGINPLVIRAKLGEKKYLIDP